MICDTKFLGLARIRLDQLHFADSIKQGHREASEKVETRLLTVFKFVGCLRLEAENFIDAEVDSNALNLALLRANLTEAEIEAKAQNDIYDSAQVPALSFEQGITCLNGLHRIRAAESFLDLNDQWWIVRLYSNVEKKASTRLLESYAHEQSYSDGQIFRKIRLYHRDGDLESEKRWWARLSVTKRKDLKQLLGVDSLREAFDALLPFPGLWTPVQLGTLHRLHGLRCTEELLNYLRHIAKTWNEIAPNHLNLAEKVDTNTVSSLELYAPGTATADAHAVTRLMDDHKIFCEIVQPNIRVDILQRIRSIKCLIPSLRTFFENQKYLEPCASILRKLLGEREKKYSLWRGFCANYYAPEKLQVQWAEDSFKALDLPEQSYDLQKGLAYAQLWMFCFRHFAEMTPITPKLSSRLRWIGDDGELEEVKDRNERQVYNPALWHRLGCLAVELGFNTPRANEFIARDPDKDHAARFLSTARPRCKSLPNLDTHVNEVAHILSRIEENVPIPTRPIFSSALRCLRERRCGKPQYDDHNKDRINLLITLFYEESPERETKHISSLFIKRDMFRAFLSSYIDQAKPYMENFVKELDYSHDCEGSSIPNGAYRYDTERLQSEINFLKTSMIEKDVEILRLRSSERETRQPVQEDPMLERLGAEVRDLKSQNNSMLESLRNQETNNSQLRAQLEHKEASLSDSLAALQQARSNLDVEKANIEERDQMIFQLRDDIERSRAEYQQIADKMLFEEELEREYSADKRKLTALQRRFQDLQEEHDSLKTKKADLESAHVIQNIKASEKEKFLIESETILKEQVKELQAKGTEYREEIETLKRKPYEAEIRVQNLIDSDPTIADGRHGIVRNPSHAVQLFETLEVREYQQLFNDLKTITSSSRLREPEVDTTLRSVEAVFIRKDSAGAGYRSMRVLVDERDENFRDFAAALTKLIQQENPVAIYYSEQGSAYKRTTDTEISEQTLRDYEQGCLLVGTKNDTEAFIAEEDLEKATRRRKRKRRESDEIRKRRRRGSQGLLEPPP